MRGSRWRRLAAVSLAAWVIFLQVGWFAGVLGARDPVAAGRRDWVAFQRTGTRMIQGDIGEIYPGGFQDDGRPEFRDGYYFLYPPFTIWATIPLAFIPPLAAYLTAAMAVAVATLVSMWGILAATRAPPPTRRLILLWGVASAPWNAAVMLGHLGVGMLAGPALALAGWSVTRPMLTGAALGLLLAKPNWGLPLLALLVAGRRWRMTGGFLAAGGMLVAISLPLGPGLWSDWFRTMAAYGSLGAEAAAGLPWRQTTLLGALQSLTPLTVSPAAGQALWLVLAALLFGGVAVVWVRHGPRDQHFPRILGTALLGILVANPYGYFYDALLAFPAAAVLWSGSGRWHHRGMRIAALALSALTWMWMYLQFFVLRSQGPSLAGIGLGAWLVLEILDMSLSPADAGAPPGEGKASA